MRTIEEIAKQFTDELFAGDDLTDFDTQTAKNDAYVLCMAFGNHLMEQPLSDRLTAEEKRELKCRYHTNKCVIRDHRKLTGDKAQTRATARIKLLESIFGKAMFEEKG